MPSVSDATDVRTDLLLFPTEVERKSFQRGGQLPREVVLTEICGFGPIAAAARTAQLLNRIPVRRIILVGIAGSYDGRRSPVGTAVTFDEVASEGVGAGQGDLFRGAAALGFAQWPGSPDTCDGAVYERLRLEPLVPTDHTTASRLLVTVCAASGSMAEASRRRTSFPNAAAEDMEGFGVALAGALHQVPVSVVRGISNIAGDRGRNHWEIESALENARRLVVAALLGTQPGGQKSPTEDAGS